MERTANTQVELKRSTYKMFSRYRLGFSTIQCCLPVQSLVYSATIIKKIVTRTPGIHFGDNTLNVTLLFVYIKPPQDAFKLKL